jgi:hypothetical protein
MALEYTQPLTEISTRNLPGSKGRPTRKPNLTAICEPTVYKIREPLRLTTLWASTACYRDSFTFNNTLVFIFQRSPQTVPNAHIIVLWG